MKKLILLLLAVCAAVVLSQVAALAQSAGSLKGTVSDKNAQPIPFANVALYNKSKALVTGCLADFEGRYQILPVVPDTYDIIVFAIAYNETEIKKVAIQPGKETFLDVTLQYGNKKLASVMIIENSEHIQADRAMQAVTYDRQDIVARMPVHDASKNTTPRGSRGKNTVSVDMAQACGVPVSTEQDPIMVASAALYPTDEYTRFEDNPFLPSRLAPLSTFSVDVDKASYSLVRKYIGRGELPPADAVRTEELVNYFDYGYPDPDDGHPFRILTELTECPWNKESRILKLALQGKHIPQEELPPSVFTFLVDVSGSMSDANKLPLVKASLLKLLDRMRPQDKVGIVVYAGAAGVVLEPASVGKKSVVADKIMNMAAGGSTAGGQGIQLAYKLAGEHFITGGNNRIILCTDGDFNVGISSAADLATLIENERKKGIFLTVLGFGMGNYKDSRLETLADKGNGNYAYIDDYDEADKFLGREFAGSMYTIAKDVKIQIEFNPDIVKSYRLIGYENRVLAAEDFNDDKKDAGEIGAGHTVTALYEIRADEQFCKKVDVLKYRKYNTTLADKTSPDGLAVVKFRYKKPDGRESILIEKELGNDTRPFVQAEADTRFAVAVAFFGMVLRQSAYVKDFETADILPIASESLADDPGGLRGEFITLLKDYKKIKG